MATNECGRADGCVSVAGPHARLIAVVGGESTGKSTLVADLAAALPGLAVSETLRGWVAEHGRVPTQAEQWQVMAAQAQRERDATTRASEQGLGWVVSDGSLVMTAVYSLLYYDDRELLPEALAAAAQAALVVWCDADIPWESDDGQRDGSQWRDDAQRLIGEVLTDAGRDMGLHWLQVSGSREQRVATVVMALAVG